MNIHFKCQLRKNENSYISSRITFKTKLRIIRIVIQSELFNQIYCLNTYT